MAREFGAVGPDRRPSGQVYWFIRCRIEEKIYRLRGFRTPRGKWIRFRDEGSAEEALGEIRADLRGGVAPLQAISDFLPTGCPRDAFPAPLQALLRGQGALRDMGWRGAILIPPQRR